MLPSFCPLRDLAKMSFVSCVHSSFFFSYQSESNRIYSPTLFVSNPSSTMPKKGKSLMLRIFN